MIQFIPVETPNQITQLASIADKVWHEFFPGIITEEQIDYMVEKFQSKEAITKAIAQDGYLYCFLELNGIYIGYVGARAEETTGKLFLSKLYILKPYRGKGYASETFEFLAGLAEAWNLNTIYLTVNKRNDHSVAVYEHRGFTTVREEATDIGNGFVMDDFIMEWKL